MSAIQWNERASAAANAKRELPRMMSAYFAEVREALGAKISPANLHEIRLASKKVRYTLELLQPCYGEEFAERMEALKDVQTSLGEVNDAVATARLLGDSMPSSPRRKMVRAYLKKLAAEKAEEFRIHWTEKFDAAGEEARWMQVLGNPRRVKQDAGDKTSRPSTGGSGGGEAAEEAPRRAARQRRLV
jgi:CHAD domain-containing protein